MHVHIESKDQIVEKKTDDRGRLLLGAEYAGKEVQVAVLEVRGPSDKEDNNEK